ncbi:hypothetical protein BGZ83_005935 [Gryganskiella cystojenkinii]|nr:hypothetical protein BGZ83_005935 [Gryganskiella cystojenkinii]
MKFSRSIPALSSTTLFFLLLNLTSLPSVTLACDRPCQIEVSHAFSEKYQILSDHYFSLIRDTLETTVFHGIPIGTTATIPQDQAKEAIRIFQEAVSRAQDSWDVDLSRKVYESLFEDEPNFVGDCVADIPPEIVNPKFTQGPTPGSTIEWTMQDCHATDYICGKTPSICHFLPMIKLRVGNKLRGLLRSKMDTGDDTDLYANYLSPALQRILVKFGGEGGEAGERSGGLNEYKIALHGNLNMIMEKCVEEIDASTNVGGGFGSWLKVWDREIQERVLTFS